MFTVSPDRLLPHDATSGPVLRGHSFKLQKRRFNTSLRLSHFAGRVVNKRNRLPDFVVEAETLNCFKNRLDFVTETFEVLYG